jgi:hypothetical protein
MNCFRLLEPTHRFAKKLVGLKSTARRVLDQLCLGAALGKNAGKISALIVTANMSD